MRHRRSCEGRALANCGAADQITFRYQSQDSTSARLRRFGQAARSLFVVTVHAWSSGHTISPHPSSREGHHSTAGRSSSFLILHLILCGFHAAATSLVHGNSVPSTQMLCITTAMHRTNCEKRLVVKALTPKALMRGQRGCA